MVQSFWLSNPGLRGPGLRHGSCGLWESVVGLCRASAEYPPHCYQDTVLLSAALSLPCSSPSLCKDTTGFRPRQEKKSFIERKGAIFQRWQVKMNNDSLGSFHLCFLCYLEMTLPLLMPSFKSKSFIVILHCWDLKQKDNKERSALTGLEVMPLKWGRTFSLLVLNMYWMLLHQIRAAGR